MLSGAPRKNGGARARGGVHGGSTRRAGASGIGAGRSPSSVQTGAPAGRRSRGSSKRDREVPFHIPVTPAPTKTGVETYETPVEDGSILEPDAAVVKTEVAVASKADATGAHPVGLVATGELDTPMKDSLCSEPDSAVKTEVGISFPSKRAAAAGELINKATFASAAEPNFPPSCCRMLDLLSP